MEKPAVTSHVLLAPRCPPRRQHGPMVLFQCRSISHILNYWAAAYGPVNLVSHLDTCFAWINYKFLLFNEILLPKGNIIFPDKMKKFSSWLCDRDMAFWMFLLLSVIELFSDTTNHLVHGIGCPSAWGTNCCILIDSMTFSLFHLSWNLYFLYPTSFL